MKKLIIALIIIALVGLAAYMVKSYRDNAIYRNPAFASGNGRLEATEVNIAAKLDGRIDQILVDEGDYVKKGQKLVQMQVNVLNAELASAKAKIKVKEAELASAKATQEQKDSVFKNAERRYQRSKTLVEKNAASQQTYENDLALYESSKAELDAARASVQQAEANIVAAKADADRIQANIDDSTLLAPLDGRIQYKISEVGEVLSSGGKVLNLVDLTDVYLTFFLPEATAGKVSIGADVRLVLDAIPDVPIPAKVSYVASVAQFTPKTVETKIEREKLMFRVKAKIDPELLRKYIDYVKTGIPGVAWVRLDNRAEWPDFLKLAAARQSEQAKVQPNGVPTPAGIKQAIVQKQAADQKQAAATKQAAQKPAAATKQAAQKPAAAPKQGAAKK
ncbi:MAG: HlyD family efflux transporter periplasmic adaptor subunit [Lentisphaeria bacterium]|nr:HlyD family efflux transporter periplasmic adaptor subunit [Lentisphaeria bacterium]